MLKVDDAIAIPPDEFTWDFVRSGGPGGQNVNKVHSKPVLRWDPTRSPSLPDAVRERLLRALASRLTTAGELIITSARTPDQGRNPADCLDKLGRLVLGQARAPAPRPP